MTPPHSHIDNSYAANHIIHTPISVTSNLNQLVSLTQSMKKKNYFFKELLLLNTTCGIFFFFNDRILLIFNVLLTLGHTWHACINVIRTRVKQQQSTILCLT